MTGFKGRAADLAMAALSIAVGVILIVGTVTMEVRGKQVPGPQFFPILVSILLLVVGAILLAKQLIGLRDDRRRTWHRPDVAEDMLRDIGANTELIELDAIRAEEARRGATAVASPDGDSAPAAEEEGANWKAIGLVVLAIVVFIAILEPVGWILSAAALFWAVARCFGSRRTLLDAGVGLLVASAVQLIFVAGLGLTLPSGFLGVLF